MPDAGPTRRSVSSCDRSRSKDSIPRSASSWPVLLAAALRLLAEKLPFVIVMLGVFIQDRVVFDLRERHARFHKNRIGRSCMVKREKARIDLRIRPVFHGERQLVRKQI